MLGLYLGAKMGQKSIFWSMLAPWGLPWEPRTSFWTIWGAFRLNFGAIYGANNHHEVEFKADATATCSRFRPETT